MLKSLESIINIKYPDCINNSICDLGCPPARTDSFNCQTKKQDFIPKDFINIEKIKDSLRLNCKICDGIKIDNNKNNILFIEITAPYSKIDTTKNLVAELKKIKLKNIPEEFAKKIIGTIQTITAIIKKEIDIKLIFKPVFKNKLPKKQYKNQICYITNNIDYNLIVGSIPIEDTKIKKLNPLLCE